MEYGFISFVSSRCEVWRKKPHSALEERAQCPGREKYVHYHLCEGHGHAGMWLAQGACAGADGAGRGEPSWGWGVKGPASSQGGSGH